MAEPEKTDRNERIYILSDAGQGVGHIARMFGISWQRVQQILRRRSIPRVSAPLDKRVRYGMMNCEACDVLFVPERHRSIRYCRTCGPKSLRHHGDEFIAQARTLWDRELTASQVARELGVKKNVISGIAHRNGFTPRPSPLRRCVSDNQDAYP